MYQDDENICLATYCMVVAVCLSTSLHLQPIIYKQQHWQTTTTNIFISLRLDSFKVVVT